jgi:hypothetical protein
MMPATCFQNNPPSGFSFTRFPFGGLTGGVPMSPLVYLLVNNLMPIY